MTFLDELGLAAAEAQRVGDVSTARMLEESRRRLHSAIDKLRDVGAIETKALAAEIEAADTPEETVNG